MFLRKRKYTYQDFLNTNIQTTKPMNKPETIPKIQALLNKINPPIDKIDKPKTDKNLNNEQIKPIINNEQINRIINNIKPLFIKPKSNEEWLKFHKK